MGADVLDENGTATDQADANLLISLHHGLAQGSVDRGTAGRALQAAGNAHARRISGSVRKRSPSACVTRCGLTTSSTATIAATIIFSPRAAVSTSWRPSSTAAPTAARAGAAARCTSPRRKSASSPRAPFWERRRRVAVGSALAFKMDGARSRRRHVLRRGRDGRGLVLRERELRIAQEIAGAVRMREQSLRDREPIAAAATRRDRPVRAGRGRSRSKRCASTATTFSKSTAPPKPSSANCAPATARFFSSA